MTAKRFTIVDEQFISYYGGTGHLISNEECEIWLWHSKEESYKVCDKLNSILDENERLKSELLDIEEDRDYYKSKASSLEEGYIQLQDREIRLKKENEQLKQSSTMYYNLFVELQKQMKGVKKASDLDSKDFEDLIKLAKGNVFDDGIGWIHLPVKELEE